MDIVNVEDLALDFTVPGYDIELRVSLILSSSFKWVLMHVIAWRT